VLLGRCNLLDHIAFDYVPFPTGSRWAKDDLTIILVGVYYQRLKSIADELRELGDPIVEDR
jgi:hypothetical protein